MGIPVDLRYCNPPTLTFVGVWGSDDPPGRAERVYSDSHGVYERQRTVFCISACRRWQGYTWTKCGW